MFRSKVIRTFLFVACCAAFTNLSHAQGGRCTDNRINTAFNASMHRAPNGAGSGPSSGECDASRYGGGSWTSQDDLVQRTGYSTWCPNPWVGQVYWNLYHRGPRPQECDVNQYGPGATSSYMTLTSMIQQYQQRASAPPASQPLGSMPPSGMGSGDLFMDNQGNLRNSSNAVVIPSNSYLVAQGGGNLVAQGGGNLLPGSIIQGGAASLGGYGLKSADGKRIVKGNILPPRR